VTTQRRQPGVHGIVFLLCLVVVVCKALLIWSDCPAATSDAGPLLLRDPTLSRTQVAFSYAGTIWIVNRNGSKLRQLTHGVRDRKPCFSPDGSLVAYSADYLDQPYQLHQSSGIFVVPAAGGESHQLTFHPSDLAVTGWTADGKRLLFTSRRTDIDLHHQTFLQLFSVPVGGGYVSRLPLPRAAQASLSPDGKHIAFVPNVRTQPEWKRYKGGQTTPIWIAGLADSGIEARIPRDNSNDSNPMWVGGTVYFLSDRSGPVTLFAYDVSSKSVRQVIDADGLDIKSAAATSDAIVYEQFGSLQLLDLASGRKRALDIRPEPDLAGLQPHLQKITSDGIRFASLSPTGQEMLFGLHGEVLTAAVDANGGSDIRNVTRTIDVEERDPSWSPNGQSIAYFSDESGEYALHIRDREGRQEARKIDLGKPPSFYYAPVWSPDSEKIAYTDVRLNYWYVDLESGKRVRIDTDLYVNLSQKGEMVWSPDNRWIAYTRQLPNRLHAVFAYSLDEARIYQVTDGRSDALHVAFDKDGQHLYFTASTDVALATGWLQMSRMGRSVTRNVYSIDLKQVIDLLRAGADQNSLSRQITLLHVPARNYCALTAGPPGVLYLVEWPQLDPRDSMSVTNAPTKVQKLDLKSDRLEQVLDEAVDITRYPDMRSTLRISYDGRRMLYARQGRWFVSAADSTVGTKSAVTLNFGDVQIYVDPRAEWKHMFAQIWRDERDFFYDPGLHGIDIAAIEKTYEPFLANIGTRDDLDYLFNEMLGNLTVGHMAALSTQTPESSASRMGFLGADYDVDQGRYRFARIYDPDPWNSETHAPLRQSGVDVHTGDMLLAIDGREVHPTVDIYSYFGKTAGKQVVLKIAPQSDMAHPYSVTVVPVADETSLRNYGWVEDNRRKVETLSGGRVAYVYLPDVYIYGYQTFNREYFSQTDKEALILDERYNYGGIDPDYIINCLSRPLMDYHYTRYGLDIAGPQGGFFGPKAMLINEMSASGGDELAWMFRKAELGPLIGKRTWGGLVGSYTMPDDLLDGGTVSTPNLAFYDTDDAWIIENHGVAPDIEVEADPKAVRQGHDPQLETAIAAVLDQLRKETPSRLVQHPPFPNYQQPQSPNYQTKLRRDALH
jgi:tricorn protease